MMRPCQAWTASGRKANPGNDRFIQDASDLFPQSKRAHLCNVLDGWPKGMRVTPDWAFLDSPYGIQARGKYSDLPGDLGNMSLHEFHAAMRGLFRALEAHKAPKSHASSRESQHKNESQAFLQIQSVQKPIQSNNG